MRVVEWKYRLAYFRWITSSHEHLVWLHEVYLLAGAMNFKLQIVASRLCDPSGREL